MRNTLDLPARSMAEDVMVSRLPRSVDTKPRQDQVAHWNKIAWHYFTT
jgi:hypothetical protein